MLACALKRIWTTQCVCVQMPSGHDVPLEELCFGETNLDKSSLGYALTVKCDAVIIIYYLYTRSAKFEEEPRNIYNILRASPKWYFVLSGATFALALLLEGNPVVARGVFILLARCTGTVKFVHVVKLGKEVNTASHK